MEREDKMGALGEMMLLLLRFLFNGHTCRAIAAMDFEEDNWEVTDWNPS